MVIKRKFTFGIMSLLLFVAVFCVILLIMREYFRAPEASAVIWCSVPDAELYFESRSLGKLPLRITESDLADISGIPWDSIRGGTWVPNGNPGYVSYKTSQLEIQLYLQVPIAFQTSYEIAKTKWGDRTVIGGLSIQEGSQIDTRIFLYPTPNGTPVLVTGATDKLEIHAVSPDKD